MYAVEECEKENENVASMWYKKKLHLWFQLLHRTIILVRTCQSGETSSQKPLIDDKMLYFDSIGYLYPQATLIDRLY